MAIPFSHIVIREAKVADVPLILEFIRKKADFDKVSHTVEATEGTLREALFRSSNPSAYVLFAELSGQTVGFAVYFLTFSSFLGRQGIWMDDLFVDAAARGKGVGKALLTYLATLAEERKYGRLEWLASTANEKGLSFYRRNGAIVLEKSRLLRISHPEIHHLAQRESAYGAVPFPLL